MKKKKTIKNILAHTVLTILAIVWVSPLFWILLTSFRAQKGAYTSSFFPKQYSLDNYVLHQGLSICQSNEIKENEAVINIKKGLVIVFETKD